MPEITTREWVEKVLTEHRQLDRMVVDLRRFLEGPRPEIGKQGFHSWSSDLSKRLIRLHDKLFRHFRAEERGGMIEELAESHPRAEGAAHALLDEHKDLLRQLRRITAATLEYSEGRPPADMALRQRLVMLLDGLRRHEETETELIQRLEYEELGLGD